MKPLSRNYYYSVFLALLLVPAALPAAVRLVLTTSNYLPDGVTVAPGSFLQALQLAAAGDTIAFAIPGTGAQVIPTPLGGYPLITADRLTIDGYTQPGAVPNTNSILGGNNAQIKIVLDSTGADSAPNPRNASLPLRRSTRLDFPDFPGNTGYGTSENAILGVFEADNVTIRGLSFIARRTAGSDADPSIYGVALVKQALNARVQGCWFGLAPGGTSLTHVKPPASAIAAFRWRIGGDVYSEGALIGTDGDGVSDRAEFNVMIGGRITLALELPRARVSGNFVNVFPDGLHFLDMDANYQLWRDTFTDGGSDPNDVTLENFENGRVTDDTVIGTNGDGVSDADERNVFGHAVYSHDIEFYSSAPRVVIAGNYFGVGVDGVSLAPLSTNKQPNLVELPGIASIRIGSNGDGVGDAVEGNVIGGVPGSRFCISGTSTPIVARGNRFINNGFRAIPFADGENAGWSGYYAPFLANSGLGVTPMVTSFAGGKVNGKFPAPSAGAPNAIIDVYMADPAALANNAYFPAPLVHGRRLLASVVDNSAADLNPAANEFSIDLSAAGLPAGAYVAVAVSYSQDAGAFNAARSVTGPFSNPVAVRPTLAIRHFLTPADEVELSWLAPQGAYRAQMNETFLPVNWLDIFGESYTGGRNVVRTAFDPFAASEFFRLISR